EFGDEDGRNKPRPWRNSLGYSRPAPPSAPEFLKAGRGARRRRAVTTLIFRRRNHDPRENGALRRNQIDDSFPGEDEHLLQLRLGEDRFLTRALNFHKVAVLSRDQIEVDRDRFVLFIIQIDNRISVEHAGAHRRDQFLDWRRIELFFLRQPSTRN